jgi:hypothetical protein
MPDGQEQSPKTECRNPKSEARNAATVPATVWFSDFELRASFGIRISGFGFMLYQRLASLFGAALRDSD